MSLRKPPPAMTEQPPDRPQRGPRRLHETCIELEVPFHDVDALQIVWHGHYYKYLELARSQLLRSRRLDVKDLMELGMGLVMIESACRYASPLFYADRVRVSAWLRDIKHRVFIAYEVTNLTRNRRAARAHTILTATDREGRMLLRTPPAILERLAPDAGGLRPATGARPIGSR